jgi:hypothetical protein
MFCGFRIAQSVAITLAVAASAVISGGCSSGGEISENPNASSLVKQRQKMAKEAANAERNALCVPADPKKQANSVTRESLMTLLAYPRQSGVYLEPQLLGKAKLEVFELEGENKAAFFYLPASDSEGEKLSNAICRLAVNKAKVEIAKENDGKFVLGGRQFLRTPEKAIFLRVPLDNWRVDSDLPLKFPFHQATYSPTLEELHFLMRNESIYGGLLEALPDTRGYGQDTLYNYGTIVAKQGEGSLERFVNDLTKDIGAADPQAREKKIQRLADLVSREIGASPEEIPLKVIKRASEVLITGEGEYPARAVLLGSLLEQLQEDYVLVYSKDFLNVAVKQGLFPAKNEYQLKFEGANWPVIDTSVPGFRVGLDAPKMRRGTVTYVQRPRQNSVITNLETGSSLPFK